MCVSVACSLLKGGGHGESHTALSDAVAGGSGANANRDAVLTPATHAFINASVCLVRAAACVG